MIDRIPVESPLCATVHGRTPFWDDAWADPGGTIFGPGPYLHLPYGGGDLFSPEWHCVTRVFFEPSIFLKKKNAKLVGLEKNDAGIWEWIVERNP